MSVKPTCRFCPRTVRRSGHICVACRMEGRSEYAGMPMQSDEELHDVTWSSAQREYHGDTTRDDL